MGIAVEAMSCFPSPWLKSCRSDRNASLRVPGSIRRMVSKLKGLMTNLSRNLLHCVRSPQHNYAASQASTVLVNNRTNDRATVPQTRAKKSSSSSNQASEAKSDAERMLEAMKEAHRNGYVF